MFGVDLNMPVKEQSKRSMLEHLTFFFDPLGLISLVTITGNDMYREACDLKLSWDNQLTGTIKDKVDQLERKFNTIKD